MLVHDVIVKPVISEKSTGGIALQKYTFRVAKKAGKIEIRNAVERAFGVKVVKVNTLNVRGKPRRRGRIIGFTSAWKKAIVTLQKDSKGIEFFDTMM
jgi:large subunit ribosomal protein L23